MTFARESDMYAPVCAWLTGFMQDRLARSAIRVFDASRKSLARLIQDAGLAHNLSPEWSSWDIHVDVVGIAIASKAAHSSPSGHFDVSQRTRKTRPRHYCCPME